VTAVPVTTASPGLARIGTCVSLISCFDVSSRHTHILHIYRNVPVGQVSGRGRLARWQLRRACEFIKADLAGDPSIMELAGVCGLSANRFAKAFAGHRSATSAWLLTGSVPENGVVLVVISQDPAKSASRRLPARLLPTGLRSSTRSPARFRDRFLPKRQDHPSQSPPRLLSFGSSNAMGWLRGVLSRGASPLPLVPLSKCTGMIWRSAVGRGDSHEKICAPRTRTTGPGASHRTRPIRVARIRRNSCPRILRTDSSG
jgi:hypothetical protein